MNDDGWAYYQGMSLWLDKYGIEIYWKDSLNLWNHMKSLLHLRAPVRILQVCEYIGDSPDIYHRENDFHTIFSTNMQQAEKLWKFKINCFFIFIVKHSVT